MSTAKRAELVKVIAVGNTLGEGVSWDPINEHVWWTDIQERRLYRCGLSESTPKVFELPERLGSFGFVQGSDEIVAAFESGFALYAPESRALDWLARPEHAAKNLRFNDGRVDRQGRFWAGSMVEGEGLSTAKLYCLRGRTLEVCLADISISNSICFSPDGRQLYFADTPQRAILRFDIDATTGAIGNRKVFARTPRGAFPDGSNVDAQGYVWNAHWGAARVVRYAPDGAIDMEIEIPTDQPTCIAFAGKNLDLLCVTSAREGMSPQTLATQPHAGDLFVYQLDITGLADARFEP
ncbi:MAG TPA: SMP-30/gluconolactonase/LRE family protein [Steroidobacteraceae bacterium]